MNIHRNLLRGCMLGAILGLGSLSLPAWSAHPLVTLAGSTFEIEDSTDPAYDGANIITDDAGMIDWADAGGTLMGGVVVVPDQDITIGNKTDDSAFGQGTSEDTEPPVVVAGGVPPNKSDLKKFAIYVEEDGDTFVNVAWTRVQDPSGTTNMDFELNQSNVPSANGVTPVRTAGDLLFQYDLANGGTHPELFLSEWITAASAGGASAASVCEANNKFPCWGIKQDLSAASLASGSINNVAISHALAAGLDEGMGLDPRTFGEAQFNLTQIVGAGECITFGSVYLKSRSSDSFTAALKDFVPPEDVSITNCAAVKIIKKDDAAGGGSALAGAEFTLYTDNAPIGTFGAEDTVLLDGVGDPISCTTLANGTCTITDIFAGYYCAEETMVPPNHIAADPQCFEVDPSVPILEVTFYDRQLGSILVKKEDQDGAALVGAVFDVIAANPADSDVPSLPLALSEAPDGYHCVDGLPIRDALGATIIYTVSETTIPDGYFGAADQTTSAVFETCALRTDPPVDADLNLVFTNNRKPGAILIHKTTKDVNSTPATIDHPGVTFSIYDDTDALIGSVVTDGNGEACLGDLVVGDTYKVVETLPSGYAGEGDKYVEITDDAICGSGNEDSVSFHNTPLGKFSISYDSLPVDGHGATKATITCSDAGIVGVDLFDGDSTQSNSLNFESQASYSCTIVIDP